jgi:hypothetical protein
MLDRFSAHDFVESPTSDTSSNAGDGGYFGQPVSLGKYELYIPAPAMAERGQSFLYHVATRNFFAWLLDRPLAGAHLGLSLVGLLNSMNEFRSCDIEENFADILDYMDREAYLDMRNHPDHALAVLYFAEHFQLKDLWTDAFTHCAGMNDLLIYSPEYGVSRVFMPNMISTDNLLVHQSPNAGFD